MRRKILIRHLGNMGDMIFFIPPVLKALKQKYPEAHITFVTAWGFKETHKRWYSPTTHEYWGKRNQNGFSIALMMTNPHIDQLVHWDDVRISLAGNICREEGKRFPTWNRNYYERQKKSGKYDDIYELDFGIGHNDNPLHQIYEKIGLPKETDTDYRIYFTEEDHKIAQIVMRSAPNPRIVLLEGLASLTTRGWDPQKVPYLEHAIEQEFKVKPIWFGSKFVPKYHGRPLTLRENIATLTYCTAAIGVLSGPLHFAAAAQLPTLTLFCDQQLHRAAPAYFLNKYIKNDNQKHRTVLGPTGTPQQFLKGETASPNLTPREKKQQKFTSWIQPGKQQTKSCLSVITVEEIMTVLTEMVSSSNQSQVALAE